MNSTAIYLGNIEIFWSSILITLGMIACLALTLALYKPKNRSTAVVWIFFPLAFFFSFIFSRVLHYYFNAESYDSFFQAITDYSVGSFVLPGMFLGIWLGAGIVRKCGLVSSSGQLLDFAAPGIILLIAFIRLSALFNDSCRSKIIVNLSLFQHLPVSVASTDAAGNTTYRFATFFMEAILLVILFLWILKFFFSGRKRKMCNPCPRSGNIFRIALVAYGMIEMITDSTRYDSPLMHFRIISYLNQYSAFISLAQLFSAIAALCVLIYYSRMSIKANGFSWKHPALWLLFIGSLIGIGYFGEYRVQRYGTQKYFECYGIMAVSCILSFLSVYLLYRMCVYKDKERYEY